MPGVSDVQLGSPRPSASGMHVLWQLRAKVKTPNGTNTCECVEEVRYDLPPAEGEIATRRRSCGPNAIGSGSSKRSSIWPRGCREFDLFEFDAVREHCYVLS